MSENNDITRPLVRALERLPFILIHRLHSGSVRVRGGYMQLEPAGTPDLLVLVADPHAERPPKVIYMETKMPKEGLNLDQRERHKVLKAWGFRVEVPRSFSEGLAIVTEEIERQARRAS